METDYAVDFVLNVMKKISTSNPILFQRDGALFIASKQGFGYVTPGLQTTPEEIQEWEKREQPREISESKEAIFRVKEDGEYSLKFIEGEEAHISPILLSPDGDLFTLNDLYSSVEKLSKLEDDGKIRLINHDSGYHSHKCGYACDGVDVWLSSARVMDRNTYLELMRQNEKSLLEKLCELRVTEDDSRLKG
ncbi:MAG: hypothetical protein AABW47_00820 [Nanoarchaeota archaeon]